MQGDCEHAEQAEMGFYYSVYFIVVTSFAHAIAVLVNTYF